MEPVAYVRVAKSQPVNMVTAPHVVQVDTLALPSNGGYVYQAWLQVTSLTSCSGLRTSIISAAFDQESITNPYQGPLRQAYWLSFDRALSALAVISILGTCHTLNTM